MDFPDGLAHTLGELTVALDDGNDLQAILDVLTDDLAAVIPSYLGLTLILGIDGETVALQIPESFDHGRASLLLPLHHSSGDVPVQLLLHASAPGAFDVLGADARQTFGHADGIVVDGHIDARDGHPDLSTALTWTGEINQAIGVLLDQGHSLEDARNELHRRAGAAGTELIDAARAVLDGVIRRPGTRP